MNKLEHENPDKVSSRKVFFCHSFIYSLTVLKTLFPYPLTLFISKEGSNLDAGEIPGILVMIGTIKRGPKSHLGQEGAKWWGHTCQEGGWPEELMFN